MMYHDVITCQWCSHDVITCHWCSHDVITCQWCSHDVITCQRCSHDVITCQRCSHDVIMCHWCSHDVITCQWCSHDVITHAPRSVNFVSFPTTGRGYWLCGETLWIYAGLIHAMALFVVAVAPWQQEFITVLFLVPMAVLATTTFVLDPIFLACVYFKLCRNDVIP